LQSKAELPRETRKAGRRGERPQPSEPVRRVAEFSSVTPPSTFDRRCMRLVTGLGNRRVPVTPDRVWCDL